MAKDPETPIQFKPVTDGLGFHPFSDGLPYAPAGKPMPKLQRPEPRPAGAQAAGTPSFVYPTPRIPARPAMPTPQKSAPLAQSKSVTAAQSPPLAQARPVDEQKLGWLYPVKRILAYLIDTAFNVSLCGAALSWALSRQGLEPSLLISPSSIAFFVAFLILFNWAIITAQEVAFGSSIGKRIFGLKLQGSASALFLRAFFFIFSVGFAGVGLLWALFNRQKRCWHDVVVDLQPLEIANL